MKKAIISLVVFFLQNRIFACPVCEKQQPGILRGITHGTGPESNWDYMIVGITTLIVITTLIYSVKWLIKPGEQKTSHIKFMILTENNNGR